MLNLEKKKKKGFIFGDLPGGQELTQMENNCEKYQSIHMAYRVAQRLVCLKYSNQDEEDVRRALQRLKDAYTEGRLD